MVVPDELAEIIAEAKRQVASISIGTGFKFLTVVARVFQETAEQIAQTIYDRDRSTSSLIACKKGCAYCCHIPTSVRPPHPTGRTKDIYKMSVLDMITLIEKYSDIKHAMGGNISKTVVSALETARHTMVPQRCPFLKQDNACGIYQFRPVVCKIWFSVDVALCRYNLENEYLKENALTSESTSLRLSIEEPFKTALAKRFPELEFGYYDFLKTLAFIADYDLKGHLGKLEWNFDTNIPGRLIGPLLVPNSAQ